MYKLRLLIGSLLLICFSCKTGSRSKGTKDDGKIELTFLQINDVYEISPVEGGKAGGLARVATIKEKLLQENPNTFAVMAGDFLSPSLIGTLKHEGSRISGKQMIEVMNELGVDIATFGNHEFDIKENELLARLQESTFKWVSSNVHHQRGDKKEAFISGKEAQAIPRTLLLDVRDKDGTAIKLGVIGITLPSNKAEWVAYDDFFAAAKEAYTTLQKEADIVVALTHIDLEDDLELSKQNSGIRLIMGGHDHTNSYDTVGTSYVAKADANARTVYVHKLSYNKTTQQLRVNSSLTPVDTSIPDDSSTARVVNKWVSIAEKSFAAQGFNPAEVVYVAKEPLDGRESTIRHGQTNLGSIIAASISAACPQSEVALVNSGSVRLDDQLSGNITQYDILRTLPFGGKILEADLQGELLEKVLTTGRNNKGNGGYLQLDKAVYDINRQTWLINGKPLDKTKTYRVALTDYLLTGLETNFDFLKTGAPGVLKVYEPDPTNKADTRNDIRLAVNMYLKAKNEN